VGVAAAGRAVVRVAAADEAEDVATLQRIEDVAARGLAAAVADREGVAGLS